MRRSRNSAFLAWGPTLLVWLACADAVSAHGLGAECRLRDGRLEVEAYFDDDTPARAAKVQLHAGKEPDGRLVGEGVTDAAGHWACPAPVPGRYCLVVDAGAGHHVQRGLTVPENTQGNRPLAVEGGEGGQGDSRARVISEGQTRREFTSLPWGRVFLGLGVLGFTALGLWLWVARRRGFNGSAGGDRPAN